MDDLEERVILIGQKISTTRNCSIQLRTQGQSGYPSISSPAFRESSCSPGILKILKERNLEKYTAGSRAIPQKFEDGDGC